MPNSTSAWRSPMTSATADGRNAIRSIIPRLDKPYSSRARAGVTARRECPTTLQSRARYSSANATTAETSIAVNSRPNRASKSGTEANTIASTSRTMMAMISRAKREPTERGK